MLRFLSRATGASTTDAGPSTSRTKSDVRVTIHIPMYGGIFMTLPREGTWRHWNPLLPPDTPSHQELTGELEIEVPRGSGRRRVRCIRVTLVSRARLHMGPKRGWEEDTLFERSVEVKGAILLEEGSQRFKFTIVVPYSLAPFDVHPGGGIKLDLVAEVEGLKPQRVLPVGRGSGGGRVKRQGSGPGSTTVATASRQETGVWNGSAYWCREDNGPTSYGPNSNGHSNGHARNGSPGSSGSATPTSEEDRDLRPGKDILAHLTVTWCDPVQASGDEVEWLRGSACAARCVALLYNPDPENGVTTLDVRKQGFVDGVGPFDMRFLSEVWTVSAHIRTQVNLPQPSEAATIYYVNVSLNQTSCIKSPRDPVETPPIVSTTPFVILEKGTKPPPTRPGMGMPPALWRGKEAQGTDEGEFVLEGIGQLPNDERGRPSTLPGVITPIRVSHALQVEVWYSVYGEDAQGNKYPRPQPGQVRKLVVDRPVVVPACAFIPEVIELPSYESLLCDKPCTLCFTPPEKQACQTCPVTSIPHPRHDFDPSLVGNARGVCPACEKRFATHDDNPMGMCACGLGLDKLEQRMRNITLDRSWFDALVPEDGSVNSVETKSSEERNSEDRRRSSGASV